MMFYKNIKVKVRSLDGDTDFFDIVAGVLQAETLAPYVFIICLDNVLRMWSDLMKINGLTLLEQEADNTPQKILRMWTALML